MFIHPIRVHANIYPIISNHVNPITLKIGLLSFFAITYTKILGTVNKISLTLGNTKTRKRFMVSKKIKRNDPLNHMVTPKPNI